MYNLHTTPSFQCRLIIFNGHWNTIITSPMLADILWYEMHPISHVVSERQENIYLATMRLLGLKKYLAGSRRVKLRQEELNQRLLKATGAQISCHQCCPPQSWKTVQSSLTWRSRRQVKGSPVAAVCGDLCEETLPSKTAERNVAADATAHLIPTVLLCGPQRCHLGFVA